ncbi:recombinase RecT [Gordonia sp. (in: high G+C Gram-positive bacteria)]|uniref:recombinase RecT n=1 Tax=Gordonia sp. (in: high G+C Gram-positive bacteria) TaxID=84139 RepID=UPI0026086530|nr:recombinase RecT [Gordonia sp. (in: high G+C Gram-positive bacteria)]
MGTNLKQRAMAPAQQQGEPTLAQLIERMKPEIGRALPKHMDPDRMARIATTVLRQTPQLARCTPESFLGALLTASQLGLEPGPLGEAYLVPYGREVTFIPGYRGLVKLAWQSGTIKSFNAHVVYENDEFDYSYGLEPHLTHKPARGDRGKPTEVYAAAVFKDGGSVFEVMSVEDVEAIRRRSRAGTNGPWKTDWSAMARKTVVKQLAKWMPLSPELAAAASRDGTVRTDTGELVDVTPTYVDGEMIDDTPPSVEPAGRPPADEPAPIDRDSLEAAVLAALDEAGVTDIAAHLSKLYGDKLSGLDALTDDELHQLLATTTQKEN